MTARHVRIYAAALALALASAGLALAAPAQASQSTILVPCSGSHGGVSGLSAAITAGNAAPDITTIQLSPDCTYWLTEELDVRDGGGLPGISGRMRIVAPAPLGATIQRRSNAAAFSIVNVDAGGSVWLQNVTVAGGLATDGFVGGGVAVAADGAATLIGSRVTGNRATASTAFAAFGAGIYSNGAVTLIGSRVDHNETQHNGDSGLAVGGGITSDGFNETVHATLTVRNSRIDDNTVRAVVGDAPGAVGAGIATLGNATTTITGSSVDANTAISANTGGAALGGGVFDNLDFNTGFAATSTTFSDGSIKGNVVSVNHGGFAAGAGIYDAAGDHSTLAHAIVTLNSALAHGPGAQASGGGAYLEPGATLTLQSTAHIALNIPNNCTPASC